MTVLYAEHPGTGSAVRDSESESMCPGSARDSEEAGRHVQALWNQSVVMTVGPVSRDQTHVLAGVSGVVGEGWYESDCEVISFMNITDDDDDEDDGDFFDDEDEEEEEGEDSCPSEKEDVTSDDDDDDFDDDE